MLLNQQYALQKAHLNVKGLDRLHKGKVRELYANANQLFIISTDRISAFDCILPQLIHCKGQVLNQLSAYWFAQTKDLVPNWFIKAPHPRISIGWACKPIGVEFIVRGYLAGHAARQYESGIRSLCGEPLPEGLKRYQALPEPILTPTTKAAKDKDLSGAAIVSSGLMSQAQYEKARDYALKLYAFGHKHALERGLILVDAKYEFGTTSDGRLILIDELHTPDSARYFYADDYEASMKAGRTPRQFSKEYVRQWLIARGVKGTAAVLSDECVQELAKRYIEVYEQLTKKPFAPSIVNLADIEERIRACLLQNKALDKASI